MHEDKHPYPDSHPQCIAFNPYARFFYFLLRNAAKFASFDKCPYALKY